MSMIDFVKAFLKKNDISRKLYFKTILRFLLSFVSNKKIVKEIGMARLSEIIFLLMLKHKGNMELVPSEDDIIIKFGKHCIAKLSYLAVTIQFIELKGNKLLIEGNISIPKCLKNRNDFYIRINQEKKEIELSKVSFEQKIGVNIYESNNLFEIILDLVESENIIEFFNCIDGYECNYGKINSMRFVPVADNLPNQYCKFGNYIMFIKENKLCCNFITSLKTLEVAENNFRNTIMQSVDINRRQILNLRNSYFEGVKKKRKPIWLIMDRPNRADDNGEVFFKYMQMHKEIDSYFVIDKKSKDYIRLSKIGKTVDINSINHLSLHLMSDIIISSQCNGVVENPFWDLSEFFRDIYHKPKIIFLQHGVIKDDLSESLNRFHTNFSGFITSTLAEYNSILDYPYFYSKEKIWLTGLPIFDELKNNSQRIIIIMPTWRASLMQQRFNNATQEMEWVLRKNNTTKDYFKRYNALINNQRLKKMCLEYNYKIAFMPHPLMEKYFKNLINFKEVLFWDSTKSYRDAFAEGDLLVTDYSSVAFEFAYLNKPIVYYQFDKNEFYINHTYKKGYFDYNLDGFGEICEEEDMLIKIISQYLQNGCKLNEKYKKRIGNLYNFDAGKVCENIYGRIDKLVNER